MKIKGRGRSEVGKVRSNNEDRFYPLPHRVDHRFTGHFSTGLSTHPIGHHEDPSVGIAAPSYLLSISGESLRKLVREDPILGNKLLTRLLARMSRLIQELVLEQ